MLLPSYFIIDITRLDELPDVPLPENAFLSYSITPDNIQHINSFYKKLVLSGRNAPFCLFIDVNDGKTLPVDEFEKNIEYLVSLSFQYAYIKLNGDNPLFIFNSGTAHSDSYITILRKNFTDQGYNNIETIIVENNSVYDHTKKDNKTICLYPKMSSDELLSEYAGAIKKITTTGYSFFFFPDNPGNITKILATIDEAELNLQKDVPQIYFLLKENRMLALKEQQLQIKAALLEEKLDSLKSYHLHTNAPETRYKKQVTELLDFYNTEYEVLPLWFKRLGHIVKVITGKRTFKSLFNDNVKKYKG
jgi:hypothetical protein